VIVVVPLGLLLLLGFMMPSALDRSIALAAQVLDPIHGTLTSVSEAGRP